MPCQVRKEVPTPIYNPVSFQLLAQRVWLRAPAVCLQSRGKPTLRGRRATATFDPLRTIGVSDSGNATGGVIGALNRVCLKP
jgi:hypothetical protein